MSTDPDQPDRPDEGDPEQPHEGGLRREGPSGLMDVTHGHRAVPSDEIIEHETSLPQEGELEPDIERIHRLILREPADPQEGREPVPWWLWAIGALALFWGGWYLGYHGGSFGSDVHVAYHRTTEFVEGQAGQQAEEAIANPVEAGQRIYTARCQVCHQANGQGQPGVFPPIVGSEWVTGAPETVVRILLHGMQGPVTVAGQSFNGAMPGWGNILSDAEIAAVATFIRQWETNDAPAVEAALVQQLRSEAQRTTPWTADELRQAEAAGPETTAATSDTTAQQP